MKLLAALIFFTRLPFWRITEVPAAYFKRVVDYWPFVGWLTGGIMAGTLWLSANSFLCLQPSSLLYWHAACHGCTARRRFGRLLRRIWRRHFARENPFHHERFPYRNIRCIGTSVLLRTPMEPAFHPIAFLGMHGHSERRRME